MKASFLSDLHIKCPGDEAEALFTLFATSRQVDESTHVFLLGDMFDALVGEHKQYFEKYSLFFEFIVKWLDQGKVVKYVEGNHDFHFEKSLKRYLKEKTPQYKNFSYEIKGSRIRQQDVDFFYCHGYEVDYHNKYFKRWYAIYSSNLFRFFISYMIPFFLIELMTRKASEDSKKRGRKVFNYAEAKHKYIQGAKEFLEEIESNIIICGHTHIKEAHEFDNKKYYYNCGYPLKDKQFLYLENGNYQFINLEES